MDFGKELQEELGEHNPSEIDELILDDLCQDIDSLSQNHKSALEKYTSLIHLSINNFGLETLTNFPELKTLQILELNNNNLKGDDFDKIPTLFPLLYKIKLSSNKIESVDSLKAFIKSKITKIEVENNPFASKTINYAEALFKLLPNLKTIDRHNKEGEEVETTQYDEEEEEDISFEEGEGEDDDKESEQVNEESEAEVEENEEEDNGNDDEEEDDEEEEESDAPSKKRKK